jgi:hypothetical protein
VSDSVPAMVTLLVARTTSGLQPVTVTVTPAATEKVV